jgi:hypothetical protein
MKKIIVLVTALLVCFVVTAQNKKVVRDYKSAFSFNIGPSIPIADFASNNASNENAGYAKTGINLNLNYDHMFEKYVGISFDALYGSHKMDHKIIKDWNDGIDLPAANVTHYQYAGLLAGPVFTGMLSPEATINFKLLGGVGRARSPQATYQGEIFAKQDWASSFAWRVNTDLRFNLSQNTFFLIDLSYTQMRPDFNIVIGPHETNPETLQMEMHVSTINLNAGVGIKF